MRHLHRHTWPLILLAAGLPAGCSVSDEDPETAPETQDEIRLNADVWQVMDGTRAVTYSDAAGLRGEDLWIDAYYHDTETKYLDGKKLHYDTDDWKFWDGSAQLHYYWPIAGSVETTNSITVSSLDFVGYCPYTTPSYIKTGPTYNLSTDVISFTCDMSGAIEKEFMYAYVANQTKDSNSGTVNMQFKHPFARISFTNETSATVTVNSITISDIYTTGTCAFDGSASTWTSLGDAKSFDGNIGTTQLVIPNEYGSKTITVNATWNDWSSVTKNVSASVLLNWAAGSSYTYNLSFKDYALQVSTEKYTEQW